MVVPFFNLHTQQQALTRTGFSRCLAMVTSDLSLVRSIVRFGVTSGRVGLSLKVRIAMLRKMSVGLLYALILCPHVNAGITFTAPAGGTDWHRPLPVTASGSTSQAGGERLILSFCYVSGGVEIAEGTVIHIVAGPVGGPNVWSDTITATTPYSCWFGIWCTGGWTLSPTVPSPPPPIVRNHYVKAMGHDTRVSPPVPMTAYRFDQGVIP
jgi:hypothetical protein